MSALGPTWATAGTVTLGTGNTFDIADATEPGGPRPYWRAWGRYTAPANGNLTLDTLATTGGDPALIDTIIQVYPDSVSAPADFDWIARNDDSHGGLLSEVTLPVTAGATYYILIGSFDSDGDTITTYRLNAVLARTVVRRTAWIDELVDDPDNVLVISATPSSFPGDLQSTQVAVGFQASHDFYYSVLDSSMPGRRGEYRIVESFPAFSGDGTENPAGNPHGSGSGNTGADDCAFGHALNGDQDTQVWNTDTYDVTLGGPPVCRPPGTGGADSYGNTAGGYRYYHRAVSDLFVADDIQATDGMGARALWVGRLLGDLQVFYGNDDYHLGTLPYPERPDGVPDDAVIEWESELELRSVKGTADRVNRSDYTGLPVSFYVNDPILPTYSGGWSVWQKGPVSAATFTGYGNESMPPLYDFGINSWADANDPESGVPDAVIGTGLDTGERPTIATGDYGIGADSDLAVIIGLGSPRYRWVWTEDAPTTVPVPVRKTPRRDGDGYESATRVLASIPAERHIGGLWD